MRGLNLVSLAKKVAPPFVFTSALTADIQPAINAEATLFGKLKHITNAITGRTVGINLFSDTTTYAQKINPSGMWNPFTQSAATMIGVGFLGQYLGKRLGIPGLGKLGQLKGLGGAILPAALAGGLFDDAPNGARAPGMPFGGSAATTAYRGGTSSAGYNTKQFSYSAMPARSSGNVTADIKAGAF